MFEGDGRKQDRIIKHPVSGLRTVDVNYFKTEFQMRHKRNMISHIGPSGWPICAHDENARLAASGIRNHASSAPTRSNFSILPLGQRPIKIRIENLRDGPDLPQRPSKSD